MSGATTATSTTNADDSRYYPYPPTGEPLNSVTTVIAGTNNKPWIKKWYGSTATAWCVDNLSVLARTLKDERIPAGERRKTAIDLGKDEAERLRSIKADAGTYVHDVQEALILWAASPAGTGADIAMPVLPEHLAEAWYDDEPLVDVVDFMVDGFTAFVTQFNPRFEATEMAVYNQPLGIAGTLDMIIALTGYAISYSTGPGGADEIIACPGNVLRICVDTKTGRNPEGTWKEQLAAYRRMRECLLPMGDVHPMPVTDCGAVLHLRPDYPDGYLLMLVSAADDEAAWERFQKAVSVYRDRQTIKSKPGTSVRALRTDGTMPGPRICDLASEGYGRALSPLTKALGAATELEDLARFTTVDLLAIKGVGPVLIGTIREMLTAHDLHLADETAPAGKAA
jgi:hypothetical protein